MSDAPLLPGVPPRATWRAVVDGPPADLGIVGGGVHGAGIARDAALRGLSVVLLERGDWGSGTSSRSSRLFHGGLRYLEHGALSFVRESLRERNLHLRLMPDLVRPLRFRVPRRDASVKLRAGIALYDLLTGGASHSRPFAGEPSYEDALCDDARFVLELMLDARRRGARAVNHAAVTGWVEENGRVVGVTARDRASGEEATIRAARWVNAGGPWAAELARTPEALRLTRGSHVILAGDAPDPDARLFRSPDDDRVLFLIPIGGDRTLLGTTDLDEPAPLVDPVPREEEIRYLAHAFVDRFPERRAWRPVGLRCGLRPLLAAGGKPSSLSREERIEEDERGVIHVLGGKYTTYRRVAERVLERIAGPAQGVRSTRNVPLPAAPPISPEGAIHRAFDAEDAVLPEDVLRRRTGWEERGEAEPRIDAVLEAWAARFRPAPGIAEAVAHGLRAGLARRRAPLDAWPL